MRKTMCIICRKILDPVNVEDPSVCVSCLRCLDSGCPSKVLVPDYLADGTPSVTCTVCNKTWEVLAYEMQLAEYYDMVACKHCGGLGYIVRRTHARLKPKTAPAPALVAEPPLPEEAEEQEDGEDLSSSVIEEAPLAKCSGCCD